MLARSLSVPPRDESADERTERLNTSLISHVGILVRLGESGWLQTATARSAAEEQLDYEGAALVLEHAAPFTFRQAAAFLLSVRSAERFASVEIRASELREQRTLSRIQRRTYNDWLTSTRLVDTRAVEVTRLAARALSHSLRPLLSRK